MFLNIVTPCTRPDNLTIIEESINIPEHCYRWIIVFDARQLPDGFEAPKRAEMYAHFKTGSVFGSQQRNYALDIIKRGHVYFNDDDTTIHPLLWENVCDKSDYDFISFDQLNADFSRRLMGSVIVPGKIDTHTFIVDHRLTTEVRWADNDFCDGLFAQGCRNRATNPLYINKYLSFYNSLR
jgi:hypothetical protein